MSLSETVHDAGAVTHGITEQLREMYYRRCLDLAARLGKALRANSAALEVLRAALTHLHRVTAERDALRERVRELMQTIHDLQARTAA